MMTTLATPCFTLRDMGNKPRRDAAPAIQPLPMLRVIRTGLGHSQEWLAERVNMTKASISRIEKGQQNWDAAFLFAAARALGVDATDLIQAQPPEVTALMLASRGLTPGEVRTAAEMIAVLKRSGSGE